MKIATLSLLLTFSTPILASGYCDLQNNNVAVDDLNQAFDRFEMRGEDHLIQLERLYHSRLLLIKECIRNGHSGGITAKEMDDVLLVSEQDDQF